MSRPDACSQAAILCINGYQRYLSPHKGYACAHRVLHGGEGCSGFVKRAIGQHGLRAAWPLCCQRFRACKQAAGVLRQSRAPLSSPSPFESSTGETHPVPPARNRAQRWWERQKRRWRRQKEQCNPCEGCNPCDAVHVCDAAHGLRALPHAFDACFDCGPTDTGIIDCCSCWP